MTHLLRGTHHCIGTGVTVTNLVFNFIHTKAVAKKSLSAEDISELRRQFLEGFLSGFDFFEFVHDECMNASLDAKADPFARDMILSSLFFVCAKQTAMVAFKFEVQNGGIDWLDDFFYGLGKYVGDYLVPDAKSRLIAIFVDAAAKHKSKLTVTKLLQEPETKDVLKRCVQILSDKAQLSYRAAMISETVNAHLARAMGIVGAHPTKTTTADVQKFLEMLPNEAVLVIQNT